MSSQIEAILARVKTYNEQSPPPTRRRALLSALLNLALIPESDFIEIDVKRDAALVAVYDQILVWEEAG